MPSPDPIVPQAGPSRPEDPTGPRAVAAVVPCKDEADRVGATVAASLVGVVMFGTLAGSMLPFLMRRMGFDPATSSAPFVATLVDVTGLIIYFTIAQFILRGALL